VETPTPSGAAAPASAPPELAFTVDRVRPDRFAMAPTLLLDVAIERVAGGPVRSIALNTQVRIAATRRSYDARAQERLAEVFGGADQWGRSLRSFPWANLTANVGGFTDATVVELSLPCTYDFEVTSAKYLNALEDGDVPLELFFSGTIFYAEPDGGLRVAHVPWEKEAEHRLPVAVWREMMDRHFPDSAWLRLRRHSFDRLYAYKARGGFLTWEDALESLLGDDEGEG